LVYLYLQGPSLDWIFPPPKGRAFCKMKCPPITQSPTTGRHYVFWNATPLFLSFFFLWHLFGYHGKHEISLVSHWIILAKQDGPFQEQCMVLWLMDVK
jgi:hypothetical protein